MSQSSICSIIALMLPVAALVAAPVEQTFTVSSAWQVPGATLQPGDYRIRVEDTLPDRSIIQIVSMADNRVVTTFISVPSTGLQVGAESLFVFWNARDGKPTNVVRGWRAKQESNVREFVYPKAEAANLAKSSLLSVPAIDPESEPSIKSKKLTETDMRVIQLWALEVTQIKPNESGISAVKLDRSSQMASSTQTAPAPGAPPVKTPARSDSHQLPATASKTPEILTTGLFCLGLFLVLSVVKPRVLRGAETRNRQGASQ